LTAAEIRELLERSDGLGLVRGRWVEVDRERLGHMLEHFREIERTAAKNGLSFREAVRLLAGADAAASNGSTDARVEWSQVTAGSWVAEVPKGLRCGPISRWECAGSISSRNSVWGRACPMTWDLAE
jgi:SNF2 Helicase protein